MSNLLNLNVFEDLQKTLIRQKESTEKAKRELNRLTDSVMILYAPDGSFSEATTNEITRKVTNLLSSYATLPTLSEFAAKPALLNTASWGGSFGVATIVGTVMLKTLAEFSDFPAPVVKSIFIRVLKELHDVAKGGGNEISIMERIMESLCFSIKDWNGNGIIGDKRDMVIKGKVSLLLELLAKLMNDYKLIDTEKDSKGEEAASSITPLGVRVYLHLRDVESYIMEISVAYKDLSDKKKSEPLITSIK